jgi:tRNA G10  N-methylase Trm11
MTIVDSIVTDPPYGLSFMGKKWDYDVPKKKVWKECMTKTRWPT